jgi:hypothetical protein
MLGRSDIAKSYCEDSTFLTGELNFRILELKETDFNSPLSSLVSLRAISQPSNLFKPSIPALANS